MSLETLLEAAKYVEQQEIRAKQRQKIVIPFQNSQTIVTPPPSVAASPTPLVVAVKPPVPSVPEPVKAVSVVQSPVPLTNGLDNVSLVIDESSDAKRKAFPGIQGPLPNVLRSGTREVHNKLEKNRRAHLKECFDILKRQLPAQQDEKKSSNLSILHSALRYIQVLKKKERENEHEMERLAREKIAAQQRLASLKKELGAQWDNIDFSALLPETSPVPLSTLLTKEESADLSETEEATRNLVAAAPQLAPQQLQPAKLSVHLPISQVSYPVSHQGLVVGLQKVALVSKSLPLVPSPITHIITAPPQLNGKMVPLVNAQYLMKPVVVVSTASASNTITQRPS